MYVDTVPVCFLFLSVASAEKYKIFILHYNYYNLKVSYLSMRSVSVPFLLFESVIRLLL